MNRRIDTEYWQIIWKNFKDGDRAAFKSIYDEFIDALFSYGMKISQDDNLVKDAIQDLFIDVYTYGSMLRKPESLEFYLYKSLKRIIIRKLVEQKRFKSIQEINDGFCVKFSIEEVIDDLSDESLKRLRDEVSDLIPEKKELLFLKFNSGLTYKEIGKLMNIKPNTVKKQVYRILDQLRNKLGNDIIVLLAICCRT